MKDHCLIISSSHSLSIMPKYDIKILLLISENTLFCYLLLFVKNENWHNHFIYVPGVFNVPN